MQLIAINEFPYIVNNSIEKVSWIHSSLPSWKAVYSKTCTVYPMRVHTQALPSSFTLLELPKGH